MIPKNKHDEEESSQEGSTEKKKLQVQGEKQILPFECCYCSKLFDPSDVDRIPRIWSCGHSFCTGCICELLSKTKGQNI
jgi:hypothetical protein